MSELVRSVDEADFATTVVEASRTRPVVVDFWAEWCGPCRQLSPLLEEMAAAHDGHVDVVKVNVDHNPRLAQQLRVQGIPAVKAFADGRIVAELTGLHPRPVLEQFFGALAPSPADRLVADAANAGDAAVAEDVLRQALALEPDHPGAAVALAEHLDDEEARDVLTRARPTTEVQQALAALNLRSGDGDGDVATLRARVDGGEDAARVPLGKALAASGEHDEAIAVLLDGVRVAETRDAARDALLDVFTTLGNDDPRVKSARARLASALF